MMQNDKLLGRQLDEYRLEEMLGKGGMARVYRGVDVRLKRHVAIKVIDAPFRSDSDYAMRFEREAQAIAQLEHPNIVTLYRYGEVDGLLYMAMQYIQGADLKSILSSYHQDGEFIEPSESLHIIQEVCTALDYAHGKGVVHRDVKPANIMLDQGGRAYLADFGLVLLAEIGTYGEVFGSPHYISPEQAVSSASAVPQSDFYAIGVILYEMFTGVLPFEADTPTELAMKHMIEPPPPPREQRPEISPALESVILRTLAKQSEDRYETGAELITALESALKDRQTQALRPSKPTQTIPERVAVEVAENPLPTIADFVISPRDNRLLYISVAILIVLIIIATLLLINTGDTGQGSRTPLPTPNIEMTVEARLTEMASP
jgi:serine/threonine protein kinase